MDGGPYRSPPPLYTIAEPGKYTIKGPPTVRATVIRFMQHGQEVGTVEGTFDFSNLPPQLHGLALQVIQSSIITNVTVAV